MSNLAYLETIYINCEDDGSIAELGSSLHTRFCLHTGNNTCALFDKLSDLFLNCQILFQSGIKEAKVALIYPRGYYERKYKPKDDNTLYEIMKWMIENFQSPTGKIIISVYLQHGDIQLIDDGFSTHKYWPMKEQWDPNKTDRLITLQDTEGTGIPQAWKTNNFRVMKEKVLEQAAINDYEIEYLNYTQSYEHWKDVLVRSRRHFSYVGASYFLACALGVPTVGMGRKRVEKNIIDMKSNHIKLGYANLFSTSQNDWNHMKVYSPSKGIVNRAVTTAYDTKDPKDISNEFKSLVRKYD